MTDCAERAGNSIRQARILPRCLITQTQRQWVALPGSMTREVARVTRSQPTVTLRFQGPGRLASWEAQLLQMHPRQRAWVREISLDSHGRSVLLARSVTRITSPVAAMLRGLGHKPLAELLFVDPRWQRSATPVPIRSKAPLLPPAEQLPGRAAVWEYAGKRNNRLLVTEFFLPALTQQS